MDLSLNQLRIIYDRHKGELWHYCMHLTSNHTEAEDLFQEFFAKFAKLYAQGRIPANITVAYIKRDRKSVV